jgi:hypothetical protein
MALREGGPTAINGRRPRSGRVSDRADPEIRSRSGDPVWGDHIPNIASSGLVDTGNGHVSTAGTHGVCSTFDMNGK